MNYLETVLLKMRQAAPDCPERHRHRGLKLQTPTLPCFSAVDCQTPPVSIPGAATTTILKLLNVVHHIPFKIILL